MSISDYLVPFGTIVGLAWAATEGIGRVMPWPKPMVALATGVLLGVGFHWAGFIPSPSTGIGGFFLAGVVGAAASAAAGVANDYLFKAIVPGKGGKS